MQVNIPVPWIIQDLLKKNIGAKFNGTILQAEAATEEGSLDKVQIQETELKKIGWMDAIFLEPKTL